MGKSKNRNRSQERDPDVSLTQVVRQAQPRSTRLSSIQDMRVQPWLDPLSFLPALDLVGAVAGISAHEPAKKPFTRSKPAKLRFDVPQETIVCIRRGTRREVLFAKKKTGRGGRSKKTFNRFSKVHCK